MAMDRPIDLTSSDNPRVKGVLRLHKQRTRRRLGLLIAEGVRQIDRALGAGLTMREFYWCPSLIGQPLAWFDQVTKQAGAKPGYFTVTPSLITAMAYRQNPEGVLAVFEQPRWSLEALAVDSQMVRPWPDDLWLVAVGTQKPGNLGSMARSADAAGGNGVLVADGVVDAFNPNAIHASTGAVLGLPVVAASTEAIFTFIRSRGLRIVAAVPEAKTVYSEVDLTGPVALVVGAEDVGLGPVWLSVAADGPPDGLAGPVNVGSSGSRRQGGGCQVSIPMRGRVTDSLNASAAAAVLLFEAVRQRCQLCR